MKLPNKTTHTLGNVTFELPVIHPDLEQCRLLMLKVIHHAIKDLESCQHATDFSEKRIADSARSFLFNNDHHIAWGDLQLNLNDMLDILDIDIDWLRNIIQIKLQNAPIKKKKIKETGHDGNN